MKQKIDRITTGAKRVSLRALAMALCFVMLLSAVGVGTVLTAIAASSNAQAAVIGALSKVADANADDEDDGIVVNTRKSDADLADTGAKVDLAGTGWSVQNGARVYLDASALGWDSDYVHMAFRCNYDGGSTTEVVKMDHIAGTYVYTVSVNSIYSDGRSDMAYFFFFKANSSWGDTSDDWDSINKNNGVSGITNSISNDNVYKNHTYYFTVSSSGDLTEDYEKTDGYDYVDDIAIWKSNQKASVYTDDSGSYQYAGDSNTTKGGKVKVQSRYWSGDYSASDAGYTPVSGGYAQYANAAKGVTTTFTVDTVFEGYTFEGWYDTSGSLVSNDTSYVTISSGKSNSVVEYRAYFSSSNATTTYYLTGWLSGAAHADKDIAFTESDTEGVYTCTYAPTSDEGGYQYMTITASSGTTYHPASHGNGSGTAGTITDSNPTADNKWKAAAAGGDTIDLTWDTTGKNPVLSWTIRKNAANTAKWVYAQDGTTEFTPPTTAGNTYKFVWGTVDTGVGTSNTTPIATKVGTNSYWADITSYVKTNPQFFFALSNNENNGGIRGNKSEQINDDTVASGKNGTIHDNVFTVQMKDNGSVANANFQLVFGADFTKISAIGVLAVYSGTSVNYKYYYKPIVAGDDEITEVTVYAKDGAAPINWSNKGSGGASSTSGTAYNYAAIASTKITQIDDAAATGVTTANVGDASSQYQSATVKVGQEITVTTTISGSNEWNKKYYVRGWCINGVTYAANGTSGVNAGDSGENVTDGTQYTLNYTIPSDISTEKLEITPIYYLINNSGCITFYVEGYNTVQSEWGNTPYIYPFYADNNNIDNSFGVYPGQPMVYVNGQYSIEIPLKANCILSDANQAIKGITISNGYADHVHRNLIYNWSDHDNDAAHKQTYDYDDFAKIYYECTKDAAGAATGAPNAIIFRIQDESTTFNRSTYGGGKSGQFANGTANITLSDIEKNGNGWQPLTNRYDQPINIFGEKQNTTHSSYGTDKSKAIYVVSTGYNANIAGDYGTMWKIYDGDGKLISNDSTNKRYGIPPSVLVMQGNTSGITNKTDTKYSDASHSVDGVGDYTDSISLYETIYKTLKKSYNDKIVYITYEQDTQDTRSDQTGTGAYRLDGRWYYTHSSDEVQSKIEIEYWDAANGKYVAENAAAGTPSNAGCTATFSNNSTTSDKYVISYNGTYTFSATEDTGWMFTGWYLKYSETSYDELVGAPMTGAQLPATASYTIVARFMPVVNGALTITHTLSNASTGEGDVALTATLGGRTYTGTVTDGVARVYISSGISNDSNDTINVTLTTTPKYDGKVTAFAYDKFNTDKNINATVTPALPGGENTAVTSSFSISVKDLYAGTTQTTDTLAYTSTIAETLHYYDFTYTFASRNSSENDKSFTSKGVISLKDYKQFFAGNDALKQSYVKAKAPFESNFLKTLTLPNVTPTYDSNSHTYSADPTFSSATAIPSYTVTFKLPYEYYSDSGSEYKKYTSTGTYNESKPTFDLIANYDGFVTIDATDSAAGTSNKVNKVTDPTDKNHVGNDFITAPEKIGEKYFMYWEIRQKADSHQENAPIISRVYFPDFHFRIYGDYYVEAKFGDSEESSWAKTYNESSDTGCSIIYLGDSRNQWNNGSEVDAEKAADIIYNDFIFNYRENGKELKGADIEIGMLIERVIDKSDGTAKWATGSSTSSDMSQYKTYDTAQTNAIIAWLGGGTKPNVGFLDKIEWNKSDLNNKNFLEQNYYFYSAYGQNEEGDSITFETDSTVDNYVYRAYAYMKGTDGNYYVSDPVYFCMRYTANLNYSE